jgi:hypothetical protein
MKKGLAPQSKSAASQGHSLEPWPAQSLRFRLEIANRLRKPQLLDLSLTSNG